MAMKKIFFVSLILNIALAVVVAAVLKQRKTAPEESTASAQIETAQSNEKSENNSSSETGLVAGDEPVPDFHFNWRDVESADYKEYIANLRRIHCPEETIADIIIADVEKFYRAKLAPYRKKSEDKFKFWKNDNNWWARNDPANDKIVREIQKEKVALLKELLGPDYAKEQAKQNGWPSYEDDFSKSLSQETKDKMQEINEKFNDLRNEFYKKTKGYQDEDDQKEFRKLEKQQYAELARVLTPEQLEQYQLRNSQLANNLKWNELEGLSVSEDEFKAIYKAKQAQEDARTEGDEKLSRDERNKLKKESEEQLKEALGEDRFKEYQLNQDYDYRSLAKMTGKLGLDKAVAAQVYGMKADVEKTTRQVQSDKTLTSEQRKEKLQTIRAETEAEVTRQLGERGYKAYKNNNGWWIRNISPN